MVNLYPSGVKTAARPDVADGDGVWNFDRFGAALFHVLTRKATPFGSVWLVFRPFNAAIEGRDADLVVMVDCQIPSDDLIVHFF